MPFITFARRYNQKLQVRQRNIWVRDHDIGLHDIRGPSDPECNEFVKSVHFAPTKSNSQNTSVKSVLKIQLGCKIQFQP